MRISIESILNKNKNPRNGGMNAISFGSLPALKSKTGVLLKEPKITNPMQSGLLNLRIKSSKAFPINDVGMIEDLISKLKQSEKEIVTQKVSEDEQVKSRNNTIVTEQKVKLKKTKPYQYKFLKQQMREVNREVMNERSARGALTTNQS